MTTQFKDLPFLFAQSWPVRPLGEVEDEQAIVLEEISTSTLKVADFFQRFKTFFTSSNDLVLHSAKCGEYNVTVVTTKADKSDTMTFLGRAKELMTGSAAGESIVTAKCYADGACKLEMASFRSMVEFDWHKWVFFSREEKSLLPRMPLPSFDFLEMTSDDRQAKMLEMTSIATAKEPRFTLDLLVRIMAVATNTLAMMSAQMAKQSNYLITGPSADISCGIMRLPSGQLSIKHLCFDSLTVGKGYDSHIHPAVDLHMPASDLLAAETRFSNYFPLGIQAQLSRCPYFLRYKEIYGPYKKDPKTDRFFVKAIMERYQKGDLITVLDNHLIATGSSLLDINRAMHFARQICLAMMYMHAIGFAHGDLCLENIVVNEEDQIAIIDVFGACPVSRPLDPGELHVHPGYIPPAYAAILLDTRGKIELSQQNPAKVDAWQIGLVLFHLFFGYSPIAIKSPDAYLDSSKLRGQESSWIGYNLGRQMTRGYSKQQIKPPQMKYCDKILEAIQGLLHPDAEKRDTIDLAYQKLCVLESELPRMTRKELPCTLDDIRKLLTSGSATEDPVLRGVTSRSREAIAGAGVGVGIQLSPPRTRSPSFDSIEVKKEPQVLPSAAPLASPPRTWKSLLCCT